VVHQRLRAPLGDLLPVLQIGQPARLLVDIGAETGGEIGAPPSGEFFDRAAEITLDAFGPAAVDGGRVLVELQAMIDLLGAFRRYLRPIAVIHDRPLAD